MARRRQQQPPPAAGSTAARAADTRGRKSKVVTDKSSQGFLHWSTAALAAAAALVVGCVTLAWRTNLVGTSSRQAGEWRPSGSQSCKVLEKYPHDKSHFTQGLVAVSDGNLIESTGLYGQSLLNVLGKDGAVVSSHSMPRHLFGEGVTLFNGTAYQLTWREDIALAYQLASDGVTFGEPVQIRGVNRQFHRREGWGITDDGEHLIASDGSDKLYILAPKDLSLLETIKVPGKTPRGSPMWDINELEYINGRVFFNLWYQDWIGVFDMKLRTVTEWIDCRTLTKRERKRHAGADVLNGIAFVKRNTTFGQGLRMLLTGKLWGRLYEVDYEVPLPA